jgi:uncharacterized membrane protein YdjX (TVP38/TMEM64 family)
VARASRIPWRAGRGPVGNSNWRGPVWFPINYLIVEALERYHHVYGESLKVECPTGSGHLMNLNEVARDIARRLTRPFLRDAGGRRPCHGDTGRGAPARRLSPGRVAAALLLLAVLIMGGRWAGARLPAFAAWIEGIGAWGPVVFIAGYAAATLAFAPGSLLTLAAGAIFGLGRGVLYTFVAATLGASGAFLVARYLARPAIEKRLAAHPRFAAIDRAVARQGRKIVFLLRLSPVFPFNLLNYALGLTRVRFVDYLVASLGMIPGTLLYVYYGKVAGDVASLAAGAAVERGVEYYVLLALGLLATVVVTAVITRTARRALREATDVDRDVR